MSDSSDNVGRAARIYERLLCIYPRDHRQEYGPLMTQLFRDQCRAATRGGSRWALLALSLRMIPDLALSAFREHIAEQSHHMKNLPPQTLSLLLVVPAILGALLSCGFTPTQPGIALALAYFSALLLLLRAFSEWKRPESQLIRSLVWGISIAVIFAFVFPAWGRFKLPVIPSLVVIPMFLNALVPLIKMGLRLTHPRA